MTTCREQHENDAPLHSFNRWLERLSIAVTTWAGSSWAFALAALSIVIWAACGPIFHYSENWQLVVNTTTTIITFLMVFLIQRSQNKESLAVQVKLNELLASQKGASNRLINVEDLGEEEIKALHEQFSNLSQRLEAAADDCSAHSVAEAADAIRNVHKLLGEKEERKKRRQSKKGAAKT